MVTYPSPQDAEDAFYDAIDEKDADKMRGVWEDSTDIACLLPMQPLIRGRNDVTQLWQHLFRANITPQISITHIAWIDKDDVAIHLVEEQVSSTGGKSIPPMYATNVYRRGPDGWHLLLHQNAPTPPPPGSPMGRPPG